MPHTAAILIQAGGALFLCPVSLVILYMEPAIPVTYVFAIYSDH